MSEICVCVATSETYPQKLYNHDVALTVSAEGPSRAMMPMLSRSFGLLRSCAKSGLNNIGRISSRGIASSAIDGMRILPSDYSLKNDFSDCMSSER